MTALNPSRKSSEYLRENRGELETARQSHHWTAADKSRAIDILRGAVRILRHPHEVDPASGAGNCWCGRAENSSLHDVVVLGEAQ